MNGSQHPHAIPSSFRDPGGFLFRNQETNIIYRQVNLVCKKDYDHLMNSGLYDSLQKKNVLLWHKEHSPFPGCSSEAYKVLEPKQIPFISYPYEWCFSQLKDAALLTLDILKEALSYAMILKDASAFNVQFDEGKPVFIDTLSFEIYEDGSPWAAYRQFCQHFLSPLCMMKYVDLTSNQLFRIHLDGPPLDIVSKMLPWHTKFNFGMLSHVHVHAKVQEKYEDKPIRRREHKMGKLALLGLVDHLYHIIKKMTLKSAHSQWSHYYDDTNYDDTAFRDKKDFVQKTIKLYSPQTIWDLGGNIGVFSRIASEQCSHVLCFDIDPMAVELNYRLLKDNNEKQPLPLMLNLSNPSPAIGWHHQERMSLIERGPADMVLSLALIHHLCITNNVPLVRLADFFKDITRLLVIEFVPKEDSQVQRLLASREDIFPNYTIEQFEKNFLKYFSIEKKESLKTSSRVLYVMKRRS